MDVQPYLFFGGRCDEAIEFYKTVAGAKVNMLMRFKDCPEPQSTNRFPPEMADKVMHAALQIGGSVVLVSDGQCQGKPTFSGFSLSLDVSTEAEADRLFAGLGEGGKVTMPLAKTFFSSRFGMLTDRFGVSWMIYLH